MFFSYLALTAVASFFQLKRSSGPAGPTLGLPLTVLAIVDLSAPEAVAIACVAATIPRLRFREQWSFRLLGVSLAVQAIMVSFAAFTLQTLLRASVNPLIVIFLASGTLFIANTVPDVIWRRLAGERLFVNLWKRSTFWAFPYYLIGAVIAQMIYLGISGFSLSLALTTAVASYFAYRYYRAQTADERLRDQHAGAVSALHLRAIEGLALAVEAKDNINTRGHIRRVQSYAVIVGKSMGLVGKELEALHAGALLHDIGKLAVPERILTKPGKLTPEEFAKMKVHPMVGAEIVEQMQFPYPVAPIVRAHHEKWDGSGYPFGLKGESIPIGARILSVADCLDAMISDREYRQGMPIEEAMRQIVAESGKSFDPEVVEALEQQFANLEPPAKVEPKRERRLSMERVIDNGAAPDAGLDLIGAGGTPASGDFLVTIGAAAREEQLLSATAAAGTSLDPGETMRRIEAALHRQIPCDSFVFFIRRANSLNVEFATGKNKEYLSRLEVPLGDGLSGWVGQNLQPVINGNQAADPGFQCDPGEPLQSVLSLPLSSSQGLVGVLSLYRHKKDAFTRAELQLILATAPNITSALQNALTHREVESRANLDGLTGAYSRSQFLVYLDSELSRARRTEQPVALLLAELPDYRELAASFGHHKMDAVLIAISKGLRHSSREYDRLGRIAENRFALVLPGMKPLHMIAILDRLHEIAAEAGAAICGRPIEVKLGGAFYPDDSDGARNLLSVGEGRLEGPKRRWEDSLRALLDAGKLTPEEPAADAFPLVHEGARQSKR